MMVLLAMTGIIACVVYFTVGEYMRSEAQQRYQIVALRTYRKIQRRLSEVYVTNINSVHEIERDIDNPDSLYGHLRRIVMQNPCIVSSGLLFLPDYYPEKGHAFVPFATRDTSGHVSVMRIDSVYHDYFKEDWFVEQIKQDSSDWVDPYVENSQLTTHIAPRLLTTHAIPVHNREGRPVALLCSDMSLEYLRNDMLKETRRADKGLEKYLKHQSYSFVVDRHGRYIIHPDKERMLKDSLKTPVAMEGRQGAATATIDGVKSWIYYRAVRFVEWKLVIVAPEDAILLNGRVLNLIILAVMAIGLAAIYLLCRQQIRGIADPFAAKKAAMEHELSLAHDIQMSMIPPPSAVDHPSLTIHAMLTPARDVGGDLYDYLIRDNRLFFCIGDVSGKGVPAALFMSTVCGDFRLLAETESDPSSIVSRMNDVIIRNNSMSIFVTFFAGVLDLDTGHLYYCNAGHKAPRINGSPLPVVRNLPIGAMPEWVFQAQETDLVPGDTLFLYTDGLDEAMDAAHNMFGKARIEEVLRTTAPDPQILIGHMKQAVADFVNNTEQSDDLTMLAIRWKKA